MDNRSTCSPGSAADAPMRNQPRPSPRCADRCAPHVPQYAAAGVSVSHTAQCIIGVRHHSECPGGRAPGSRRSDCRGPSPRRIQAATKSTAFPPKLMSRNAGRFAPAATRYSSGLMLPSGCPPCASRYWFISTVSAAQIGAACEVPAPTASCRLNTILTPVKGSATAATSGARRRCLMSRSTDNPLCHARAGKQSRHSPAGSLRQRRVDPGALSHPPPLLVGRQGGAPDGCHRR